MALELVGGAFLSSLFQTFFDMITSSEAIRDSFREKKLDDGLLKKLEILLLSAHALIDDAEGKQLSNPHVRKWLHELKDASYEAEDLMVQICDECLSCDMEGESSSRPSKVRRLTLPVFSSSSSSSNVTREKEALEPKIVEIIDRLKLVLEQKDFMCLKESVHNRSFSQRLPATSLVEESDIYGRDDDKKKIIELLLSNDDGCGKTSVIPIVGMGGIGKTTLAGLAYNDNRVSNSFDVKAWVTVSDNFNIFRMTKAILQKLNKSQGCDNKDLQEASERYEDLNQLQEALNKALRGKKCFFVLDDVWNKNYDLWYCFKRAFESGAHGSKFVVTTRDQEIASMMAPGVRPHQLGAISDEECLQLFAKHVFNNGSSRAYPNMEMISRKIVERCRGLPLAVVSLAGLLRSEPNQKEWEKILNADIWEISDNEMEIIPSLWLSYHYLPPQLKRCFAYCSIFPKDFGFGKQELIMLWRGENLLPSRKGKSPEEVGEEYFNDLVARSLFRKTSTVTFVMHDLVSDLAKFVSAKFCLRWDDFVSDGAPINRARHLSFVYGNIGCFDEFDALSQAKSLRTLLALEKGSEAMSTPLSNFLPKLLSVAKGLRVLSLPKYPYEELPDSIGDLKHLRYLNLSSSNKLKRLPGTVCNLHFLQILLLSHCRNLTRLPKTLGLVNLQHLDVTGTLLKDMPNDLWKLRSLQFLSDFVVGENLGSSIYQLQYLHHLQGRICIAGLGNVLGSGGLSEFILKDKRIGELALYWAAKHTEGMILNFCTSDSHSQREVLARLQPHTTLTELVIGGYGGKRFAHWLGDSSFSNVTSMRLEDCKYCDSLPSLGQLPSLEELEISGFDALTIIGDDFFSSGTSSTIEPFRSLKKLKFQRMTRWRKWLFNRADGEAGVFPSLRTLTIRRCQQLVSLPSGPPQQQTHTPFPSLESIDIAICPSFESFLEWGSSSRLQSINISHCRRLLASRMRWDLRRFTSLASLDLLGCNESLAVDSFPEEGLLPTTLTSLSVRNFQFDALNGKGLEQLTSLESLSILCCRRLRCLPNEGRPASLSYLRIGDCPLLEAWCQTENGEDWRKIAHISRMTANGELIIIIITILAHTKMTKSNFFLIYCFENFTWI